MLVETLNDFRNLMFPLNLKSFEMVGGERQLVIKVDWDNDMNGAVISVAEFIYQLAPLVPPEECVIGDIINTHQECWQLDLNKYLERY